VTLEFLDAQGKLVKKFSSQAPVEAQAPPSEEGEENPFRGGPPPRVATAAGMNRFVWNLRYADATTFPGLIMWAGSVTGPRVSPGIYQVRLTADGKSQTQSLTVKKDPRLETTPEEYADSWRWPYRSATNFPRPTRPSSGFAKCESSSTSTPSAIRSASPRPPRI
jgi:hypothetical protein